MKINNKRDDFSHSKQVKLNVGCCCCCCCCLFWPGGVIGGILGSIQTKKEISTFKEDPDKTEALLIARKWFWFTFLGLALLTGLLALVLSEYSIYRALRQNLQTLLIVSVVGAPALQILASALVSSSVLRFKVQDKSVREVLIKRNSNIAIGTILGYGIGWTIIFIIANMI
ncbi:hypothetical protein MNBD_GAMMA12-3692 [hydrothermal vent metagenome]|uniref:Uncharacterized protein n=1 Tax=hydrothermal vent metagenome TaxID=652676 RepID=A0A3B0YNJ4_9ZZZZ